MTGVLTAFRSLLFQVAFYGITTLYLIVLMPLIPILPRRLLWKFGALWWVATNRVLLRVLVGIRAEFRGLERIPQGPLLIAAKHQSAWETFALLPLFRDPAFILKQELMRIPLFGWLAAKLRMIPVDRKGGTAALKTMTRRAQADMAEGRQILIFPEGTRRPPGAPPDYKFGVAYLYSTLKVPCLPVALNSGLCWRRRAFILRPGTILVEVLEPIPPGLGRAAFMARLEHDIETASNRLLAEGLDDLGTAAPDDVRRPPETLPDPRFPPPVENS
ncbi:lysophospholipid acyltransferase family protein [Xanthobacter oligotrophicus]|uniref:Lysophospholipid acyltransferase family protein n=1 Tax=Xanthobacter oligotrophicus TaxID=2607286 RepID=A0ABW6ZXJ3_9HYPH|nr:lysophospholipid acyltransferase family protein [Xanthobacter oligotrophicus]MCG5235103.1 1-acyl-sn-glycerol-3-phosphate acyltransferase [Xanthobacter oligotrophicus]